MKKIAFLGSVAAIALATSVSYAKDEKAAAPAAQPAAKPAAAPAAKPAEPAKPAAPADKAATPAKPAEPAKPADKAAPPAKGDKAAAGAPAMEKKPAEPAPAPMAPPKAPAEVAEMGKAVVGTWNCKGTVYLPGGATAPGQWQMKVKLDLDKFWLVSDMTIKKAKDNPMGGFRLLTYTTYDAAAKKWNRVMIDNYGGVEHDSSTGLNGNTVVWEGMAMGGGMQAKARHTETMVSPKETTSKGEMSMDNGKTWAPMYEGTCKK